MELLANPMPPNADAFLPCTLKTEQTTHSLGLGLLQAAAGLQGKLVVAEGSQILGSALSLDWT